ncbi:MAG: HAMP domain-containing protein [Desulfobacteraceae bacterium]|jgi:heavy metal sensor kinase|nr:MAG: HAMP domain-containing protein [Desulfobacteraceae bacterium]
MKFNSIRFKATILYTSILAVILIVFSGILFAVTRHILYRNLDEELRVKASEIVTIIKSYEALTSYETRQQHLINKLLGLEDRARLIIDEMWRSDVQALNLNNDYINIYDAAGRSVIRSGNFNESVASLFHHRLPFSGDQVVFKTIGDASLRLRAISLPFSFRQKNMLVIQVGTSLDAVARTLKWVLYFIGLSIFFILGLTSFLGRFFAGRILKPVTNVTRIADDITHTDLNLRIREMEADVEMQGLIRSFNAMIERLEQSFAHVNEFSSHVAHELKTPLAIMRGELELALSETRDVDEYRRVIAVTLEETDRMIRIIKDLLLLAKFDYNPEVFRFEKFDLTLFLKEIYEQSRILADSKQIAVQCDFPDAAIFINGDKTHLRRLFFNLINNAVTFTPAGGKIHLSLAVSVHAASIEIRDTGIGISPENLSRIFAKFYRIPNPRQDTASSGSGLGLSIARSIARAHKGDIAVVSRPGKGAVFTVTLPLA